MYVKLKNQIANSVKYHNIANQKIKTFKGDTMKNIISSKYLKFIPKIIVATLLLYSLGFAIWTIFFTETANGDNVEHIHASWLIAGGKTPYKDFFQHHNPLLWFIFSIFITLFSDAVLLADVAHSIAIITGSLSFYFVFKICYKFYSSKFAALLSLLILCPPYFYIYTFSFNPDIFMFLFLVLGIYYLLKYFETPYLKFLSYSYLSFFLSFMFTQKILINLAILGIINIYAIVKKKIKLIDVLFSLLLPFALMLGFISYLYSNNALASYWVSNYTFNFFLRESHGFNTISVIGWQTLVFSTCLALISSFYALFKSGFNYKIISILFIIELLQRCFYFAVSPYYMLPLMLYIVILNSVIINKIISKKYFLSYLLLMVAAYYAHISVASYLSTRGQNRGFINYLNDNITKCDYFINSYLGNQAFMSKDVDYYWSIPGYIDVVGEMLNIAPVPNYNELIVKYKPKIIYGGVYWNKYLINKGEMVILQKVDNRIINKYYDNTPYGEFYILKQEYWQYNCKYDENKKEWNYEN